MTETGAKNLQVIALTSKNECHLISPKKKHFQAMGQFDKALTPNFTKKNAKKNKGVPLLM